MKLPDSVLVLAPHPDDETLMAAGVIRRALMQGARARVCVVTNGDYLCQNHSKGSRRLAESLAALRLLGMREEDVFFLGYPDTGMRPEESFLYRLYHTDDPQRVFPSACGRHSYGIAGTKPDFRFALEGRHAPYSRAAFVRDLDDVLQTAAPKLVVTSSLWDAHGDHAALFYFVRDAVARLPAPRRPELWQSLVHCPAGDEHWPLPNAPCDAFTMPPGLEQDTKLRWNARIRVPLPGDMLRGPAESHLKRRAILAYQSALNFEKEPEVVRYLLAFAKSEEIFWPAED